MRLQKYMAICGVASRRKSEMMIQEGHVKVNGNLVITPGFSIDPEIDRIQVDGQDIHVSDEVYILLNKPKGVVSTSEDAHADKTVNELMPEGQRLYPVGRLDKDTEGLLLMTNDGEMTFRLTHPKHGFSKTYVCKVRGHMGDSELNQLRRGIMIDLDGNAYQTQPAEVSLIENRKGSTIFEITISEGKNRQIRKMCSSVGHEVISLKRISLGRLKDSKLKPGEWRYLTSEEIRYLKGV